ncbi:MAG: hypothetical protein KKH75_10550 [Actinobacteria bacterium]|nr:hypothetical protein [Actinomycetota bacterium]
METASLLAWVFTALLLFLTVVCALAGSGRIPRNHLIGMRLPPINQSDVAWRAGHAAGTLPSAVAFLLAMALTLIGLIAPMAYIGSIVVFVAGFVWTVVRGSRAARTS